MSLAVLAVAVVPLVLLVALVVLAVTLSRQPAPAPSLAAEAARRHALTVNVVAWAAVVFVSPWAVGLVAVAVFRATAGAGSYAGVVTALYPATVGLMFVAVHAIGERTWPRPAGPVRRAALVRRQTADVAPRRLRLLTWAWGALLVVALAVGGATAAPGGRSFQAPDTGGSISPYPGWYYGAWLIPAAVLVLAATEAVLRLVAARPAIVDADPAYDAASRQLSAHRVLRGTQLVLGLTLAGVLLVLGYGPHHAGLDGLGYAVDALAVAVALSALGAAVVPGRAPVAPAAAADDPATAAWSGGVA